MRLLILILVATVSKGFGLLAAQRPVISVGNTSFVGRGITTFREIGIEFFGGIPFAQPPLGRLRFQLPVLSTAFGNGGIINAENLGPGCLQTPNPLPPSGVSEDCLTLNVYRPSGTSSDSKLPVLVWIYGGEQPSFHATVTLTRGKYYEGAFNVGASSFYNATNLVARSVSRGTPVLVVSINYRLGPLGFPQGTEAAQNNILNLGLHDQLVALEWVQKNIDIFGGDKAKVTIAGESAGATCIALHMLKSTITTIARAVIMESLPYVPVYNPDKHDASWQEFVSAIPACASTSGTKNTLDCLRSITSSAPFEQALITTQVGFANISFQPVIDGPGGLIADRPSQLIPAGNLPTLIGSNLDEGTIIVSQFTDSVAEIQEAIAALAAPLIVTPKRSEAIMTSILNLYPDIPALGSPFGTGNNTFGLNSQYKRISAIFGDLLFQSGRRAYSQQISASGFPVFAYHFTDHDAVAFSEFSPSSVAPNSLGVPHTSELPYVFGRLMNKTQKATLLSTTMQDYWISFMSSLDPNDHHGVERLHWDKYTPGNKILMKLDGEQGSRIPDDYREDQIALWLDNPDFLHR